MSYEISLQKSLEDSDVNLANRLPNIKKIARTLLTYTASAFPTYTPHDFSHGESVEELLNVIIPDHVKQGMTSHEKFFLIVAAWLHDWGMIATHKENPEVVREDHHIRTAKNFEEMYGDLGLSEHEGRIIGLISKGHRKTDLYDSEYDVQTFEIGKTVRARLLAALLRIADECDITHNRTPEAIYHSINPTDKSEEEFKKHLSISGIGQLDEAHKLYISAVARDPKGAKALREVVNKIQVELNNVKSIFAHEGIPIDHIDLRLETRGFIDKNISFKVENSKIVELLIGEHLYAEKDVALRELVQNAMDACELDANFNFNRHHKISVVKESENSISVEDNGTGMSVDEAQDFLSCIGSSYYSTEKIKNLIDKKSFSPISKYGIGLLSSFMMSTKIKIETYKEGFEPCIFIIESANEQWFYNKGERTTTGTKITLYLNEFGKNINIEKALKKYFLCPKIEIEFSTQNGEMANFESKWSIEEAHSRYSTSKKRYNITSVKKIIEFETDDFDVILGFDHVASELCLFNHGVYVTTEDIVGLANGFFVCVNIKRDVIDLHMSRERVVVNEKWNSFVEGVFDHIFNELKATKEGEFAFIQECSSLLEGRYVFDEPFSQLINSIPFLKSFIKNMLFPNIVEDRISFLHFDEVIKLKNVTIYNSCSHDIENEIAMVRSAITCNDYIFNPYKMPKIKVKKSEDCIDLLASAFDENEMKYEEADLNSILVATATKLRIDYKDLIPKNITPVVFNSSLHPLVVIQKQAVVAKKRHSCGKTYWGALLVWKKLMDGGRFKKFMQILPSSYDCIIEKSAPKVLIDSEDNFIRMIFEKRQQGPFDKKLTNDIYRYFTYISYLPLMINQLCSCIALELIDNLENSIANTLNCPQPEPILNRMRTIGKLWYYYFDENGLKYYLPPLI